MALHTATPSLDAPPPTASCPPRLPLALGRGSSCLCSANTLYCTPIIHIRVVFVVRAFNACLTLIQCAEYLFVQMLSVSCYIIFNIIIQFNEPTFTQVAVFEKP